MANVTGTIFRPKEHGGVRRDKPELPVHVCRVEKNRCFTRLVIVQNQPVIYQSRSNRWRARISQTRKKMKKREGHRDPLDDDGVRKRERERDKVGPSDSHASTIFFCHPKTANFRSTVLSGRYLLVALRNKLPQLLAYDGVTFVRPPRRKIRELERSLMILKRIYN